MRVTFTSKDEYEIKRLAKSTDMALALWDITHNAKKEICFWIEENSPDAYDVLDEVYSRIFGIFEEHNINTNDLII